MLRNTFIHLPGVSHSKEQSFWENDVPDWNAFLQHKRIWGVGAKRMQLYKQIVRASRDALLAEDAVFFASMLPLSEHWRCFKEFKGSAVYLDVEIDTHHEITVVTITDGVDVRVLVKGVNLFKEEIERALRGVKMVVTYNGAAFDMPLLQKQFGIKWKGLHVDLKTVARRQGYEGGLKEIERRLGFSREYEEKLQVFIKGGDPALLYRMWRGSGDEYYLRLLLEYNEADAYHLFLLANKLLESDDMIQCFPKTGC